MDPFVKAASAIMVFALIIIIIVIIIVDLVNIIHVITIVFPIKAVSRSLAFMCSSFVMAYPTLTLNISAATMSNKMAAMLSIAYYL